MKYLIANWKANKTLSEATSWIDSFLAQYTPVQRKDIHIIVCPSFPYLSVAAEKLKNIKNVSVGAQDVSPYDDGPHTGEVNARILSSIAQYVIIGHSERRREKGETEEMIEQKVLQSKKYRLEPILCVRNSEDVIYDVNFVAYEPVAAIGSGQNEKPEEVIAMKAQLNLKPGCKYIYGGSVNAANCNTYTKHDAIDGLLVGSASLDPKLFSEIIKNV